MHQTPFTRIGPGKNANTLHVAKEMFSMEAICGVRLSDQDVTPRGRAKCKHCQAILAKAKEKK